MLKYILMSDSIILLS